ncbi:lipid droplet-regulating VLDL assembly factor AUP1 isoform X2 [Leucoraja erinacea]|uniref:lipid droplet-regulating VLDL assembly factor AUP1 isoform X2 n=1 Tax=Leucoraja erinaceus TaxID=7782 RepID=UPI002457D04A|nr:lipid droplet-regulating VLDL assembly factor AUP1 isoform X2 [Leucoraja erinacea]
MEAASRVENLFDFRRLPTDGLILTLLLLYAPFGICLMLIRIFIGIHVFLVSSALPDNFIRRVIVRAMCSVLGMIVSQSDPKQRDKNVKTCMANHITQFDHNVLSFLAPCHTPLLEGRAGFVSWARGYMELGWIESRTRLAETLRGYNSLEGERTLLLFPEDEMTNGKVGLLKFSSWAFSINSTIQPVVLTVKRPFIAVSVVESSWLAELLWMFFIPFTIYQVRWLPSMSLMEGESEEEFAVRVQEHLAMELGIVSTHHTKSDKLEYLKRMKHVAPPETSSVSTKCVDTTITNLLEGRVEFSPEEVSASPSSCSLSNTPHAVPHNLAAAPKVPKAAPAPKTVSKMTFEKSPVDRHLSLQDRKDALYAYAKRRYIDKHGLPTESKESLDQEH